MVRGEISSFEEFGKALVVFQTFDVGFEPDPEEGPWETTPSANALIQPYGREEFRVKDVSPFTQEEGKSTGRVILGLAEGRLSPGHSLWQVLLAVPLTLQELSQDVTAPGPVLHAGQSCYAVCQIHISPIGFSTCEGAG